MARSTIQDNLKRAAAAGATASTAARMIALEPTRRAVLPSCGANLARGHQSIRPRDAPTIRVRHLAQGLACERTEFPLRIAFVFDKLSKLPNVATYRSTLIMRVVKHTTVLPV